MHTREFKMPPPIARKWEIGSSSVRDREIALSVCQPSQRARGTEFVVVPAAGAPEARPRVAQAALPCVAHAKIAYKMNAENSRRYGVPKLRFELGFCPSFLFFSIPHNTTLEVRPRVYLDSLGMRTIFFFLLSCLAAASAFMPAAIQQPAASVRRASGLAMEVGQNYVVRVEIELEQGEP